MTQPALPFAKKGSSHARHASHSGAVTAAPRAGSQAERILRRLQTCFLGDMTYQDLAAATGLPLSTICARMNQLAKRGLVESCGVVSGPYGAKRTQWRAR